MLTPEDVENSRGDNTTLQIHWYPVKDVIDRLSVLIASYEST